MPPLPKSHRAPSAEDRFERLEARLSDEIGARLRRAREEAGLSQKEFGQAMDYSPAMISAFEGGTRRLKLSDLAKVCILLDKSPEYFLAASIPASETPRVGWALRAELAALPVDELADSLERLLDEVEGDAPIHSSVPDLSHLRPDAAAQEVLRIAGIDRPPVEMADVCRELGVPLYWRPLPDELSAVVFAIGEDGFVIGVNDRHAPTRRRFSISHELGHAVLRHEANYYLEYSVEDAWEPPDFRYLDEREANAFAASLLMDERWLREDFADGARDAAMLAERYAVSQSAMGFRLQNLGLR